MSEKTEKKKKTPTEKLKEQIVNLEKEIEAQKDLVLRTAAEFDNFKRRTENEKLKIGEYSKAQLIKQLLPTIDNANRALSFEPASEEYNKGIELIAKQLVGTIEALGIKELAKEGDEFDPNMHEAVMYQENENYTENQISAVLQQGYKIGDTGIRPAMVSVVK